MDEKFIQRIFRRYPKARKPIYFISKITDPESSLSFFGDLVWSKVPQIRLLAIRGLTGLPVPCIQWLFEGEIITLLRTAILTDPALCAELINLEREKRVQLLEEYLFGADLKLFEKAINVLLLCMEPVDPKEDAVVAGSCLLYLFYKEYGHKLNPNCLEFLMEIADINEKEEAPTDPEMDVIVLPT